MKDYLNSVCLHSSTPCCNVLWQGAAQIHLNMRELQRLQLCNETVMKLLLSRIEVYNELQLPDRLHSQPSKVHIRAQAQVHCQSAQLPQLDTA